MLRRLLILAAFAAATAATSASAALVSGSLTGEVTFSGGGIPGLEVGGAIVGTYTYDDSVVQPGLFEDVNPLTAFALTIGDVSRVFTLADMGTGASHPGRRLSGSAPGVDQIVFFFDHAVLSAFLGDTISSQSVMYTLPVTYAVSTVDSANSFEFTITGTPSAAVPEPAALALLGLGGLGIAGYVRRAGRRSAA